MAEKFVFILLLFAFTIACENSRDKTVEHKVIFYSRYIGGNNYVYRYLDNLVITNYLDNSISIKELYKIAQHYVDTVKADMSVGNVLLIGQPPGEYFNPKNEEYDDEARKHYILSFDFKNDTSSKTISKKLFSITFFVKGSSNTWYYKGVRKNFIDTLLTTNKPYNGSHMPVYNYQKKTLE